MKYPPNSRDIRESYLRWNWPIDIESIVFCAFKPMYVTSYQECYGAGVRIFSQRHALFMTPIVLIIWRRFYWKKLFSKRNKPAKPNFG